MSAEPTVWFDDDDPVSTWDRGGWTQVPNAILDLPGVSMSARMLLVMLRRYAFADEAAWPGQTRLAEHLQVSVSTVRRATRELEDAGLLRTRRRGMGATLLYRLTGQIDRSRPVTLTGEEEASADASATGCTDRSTSSALLENSPAGERPRATPARKARKRNEHMDAFALALGYQLDLVTKPTWALIAKSLQEIREVTPGVTPEQIGEAVRRYRDQNEGLRFTARAVATHWAEIWTEHESRIERMLRRADEYERGRPS